ncbi:MAG: FkbM family methyltransferase [Candidatus Campbellbacteria bacterium]|nr:FkbM family methyltransferase [Candidatus Campbellbacteria bacterium]
MKKVSNRFFKRIQESISVALLGANIYEKIRIFSVLIYRSFQHTLVRIPESSLNYTIPFHLSYNNTTFDVTLRSHEEVALLYEFFCRRVYHIQLSFEPQTIVDLGANTGISTLFLHTLFPRAHIIAVEPNPKILPLLKERLTGIANSTLVHGAVSGSRGEVNFFVHQQSLSSSLTQRSSDVQKVKVPSITLRDILETYGSKGIDLLVFDIEGAEEFLLSNIEALTHVRAILGEVHEDLIKISLEQFLSALREIYTIVIEPTKKKQRYIITGYKK